MNPNAVLVTWPDGGYSYRAYATAADARFFGNLVAKHDASATVLVGGEVIAQSDESREPNQRAVGASA